MYVLQMRCSENLRIFENLDLSHIQVAKSHRGIQVHKYFLDLSLCVLHKVKHRSYLYCKGRKEFQGALTTASFLLSYKRQLSSHVLH